MDPERAQSARLAMHYPLLTVEEAVRRMAIRESDARAFLAAEGLVRHVGKRAVVSWRAVLARIEGEATAEPCPAPPPVPDLPYIEIPDRRRKPRPAQPPT